MLRRVSALVVAASLSACYTYVPVHSDAPAASSTVVRVELTDQGTVDVTPSLGGSVQWIEGPVAQMSTSGVELQVTSLRRRGESLFKDWTGDRLTIPAANIRGVEAKTMNRSRTTAAIITASTIGVAIIAVVANSTGLFTGGNGKVINTNIH